MEGIVLLLLLPVFAASVLLSLFWLRRTMGVGPLFLFVGSVQYLQTILSTTVTVELPFGLSAALGSGAFFASGLVAVLVMYAREGTARARTLLFGIVVANVAVTLIAAVSYFLLARDAVGVDPGLRGIMVVDPQFFMVGTAVFVIDCFLIVLTFEALLTKLPRIPTTVHVIIALLAALTFDGLAFGYGSSWTAPDAENVVAGLVLAKAIGALPWGLLVGGYLRWVEPPRSGQPDHQDQSARDIFAILTHGRSVLELRARLLDTEASYARLFHTAPVGVGVIEGEDAGSLRFTAANPALLSMLGYEYATELGERPVEELLLVPWETTRLWQGVQGKDLVIHEATWVRRDESSVMLRLLASRLPANSDRGVVTVQVFAEDVTERRLLQGQLRHAQKMEAVGQLTAGLAHDFNNILTSVVASADLILEDHREGRELAEELVDDIGTAGRRGADLVRKLMAFSRKSTLTPKRVEVDAALDEFVGLIGRLLPESIQVSYQRPSVSPVNVDPGSLQQVLVNLATNARDAMPGGGLLRVGATDAVIGADFREQRGWGVPGSYVCITVADEGEGMDRETAARAFDPFFTTKKTGRGTGLGLSMTYGLMKQQGGHVEIVTEPGRGTAVKLYLPHWDPEAGAPETPRA